MSQYRLLILKCNFQVNVNIVYNLMDHLVIPVNNSAYIHIIIMNSLKLHVFCREQTRKERVKRTSDPIDIQLNLRIF